MSQTPAALPNCRNANCNRRRFIGDFVDRNEVIHFLGPPGEPARAISPRRLAWRGAIKAGRSVYFASLADIISVRSPRPNGKAQLRERIRFLCRTALLIVR